MKAIHTATLGPTFLGSKHDQLQVYNGLDAAVTLEVLYELKAMMPDHERAQVIYDFERAMQAPAMEMMLRGFRINPWARDEAVVRLKADREKVQKILDRYATVLWDKGLNANSPKQMKEFLYGVLKLPPQYARRKGDKTLTADRNALEKLEDYFHAKPIIACIKSLRILSKKISVLTTEISEDGRMRTSYNVTGTETGRWSSSANVWDTGTNLQNITKELRHIFIADEGKKLANVDLSQAESYIVGLLMWALGDPSYLDACESGDLHTYVAKLIWPNLPWTGDKAKDREIAEQKFYLHFSYRDMSKRGGHATNYYGKPWTVAKHLKVAKNLIEDFQAQYFKAFPGMAEWHRDTAQQLQINQYLETFLGMGRHFFGRPNDDATLREAIAFKPQSVVGQLLNLAMWRVWKFVPQVQLLAQVHDSIVFQYDEKDEAEVIKKVLPLMATPLTVKGRTVIIPSDVTVGWNWGEFDPKEPLKNPDGLKKWNGSDKRRRSLNTTSRLDYLLSRV